MTLLEKASNIAAIVACAAVLYLVVDIKVRHRPQGPAPQTVLPAVGKRVALVGANWPDHRLSIVIAMTTTCSFCAASLPFYERLSAAVGNSPGVALLVVSPEPTERVRSFLKINRVQSSNVLQASLPSIGVVATPTVIALDSGGVVKRVFRGLLDDSRQNELLSLVRTEVVGTDR